MKRIRVFEMAILAILSAGCAFGQSATAQAPRFKATGIQKAQMQKPATNPAPANNLYGLSADFAVTPFPFGQNSDGFDRWPCRGRDSTNPDCPTIGNPSVTFPTGGEVLGSSHYVWSFAACDANQPQSTYTPCGQTETIYEDDTNDATDDLIYTLVVTQVQNGKTVQIANSGITDFAGPNPFGSLPGFSIVIYGDQNFGTLGQTGKNNGNCAASYNYPVSWPTITYPYVVAGNKTCVDPVPGLATITATTEIATPTYKVTGSTATVKFAAKYKLAQKWSIWLQ